MFTSFGRFTALGCRGDSVGCYVLARELNPMRGKKNTFNS